VPYYDWYGNYYPYGYYGYWPSWESFGLGSDGQDTPQSQDMANAEQPWPNGGAAMADPPARDDPPEPKARADRASNSHANELAWKYIGYGDTLFAKQKYSEANDRYRKAARSAPQIAAPWFREGFALAAGGRYDLSAAAVKRGLKLDPDWPKSNVDLDQLFGGNAAAKKACLDALAAAVKDKPADADRVFMLGVLLHFDGQLNRATALFEHAEEIAGNNVGHIEAFLR
jgi:tetratricopeptide (TPR) repeat protein